MIQTARLLLRAWRQKDVTRFAVLCADPMVMRHLGGPQTREEVAAAVARQQAMQDEHGHCFWAIERRDDGALLGFCGLRRGGHTGTPVEDELEIGWRLRHDVWGKGYAGEAATASLAWGWDHTNRPRIAAWTVPANVASCKVMERLGMARRADLDFAHPAFARDHRLSAHIVYALDRHPA